MSEWLDLMVAEVKRKKEEEKAALEEVARRQDPDVENES